METIEKLTARNREETGSRAARRLRRAGELPANLLGQGEEPQALAISESEFEGILRGGAHLVNLNLGSDEVEAVIREVQYSALGDHILHVDFDRLVRGQMLELEVELDFFGDPVGASAGGIFQTHMNTLKVECLPRAIPEKIEVDVSELEIGGEVRVADVILPDGVQLAGVEPDELVAVVSAPAGEEPEEELEAEDSAEPEVLSAKKEDEKEGED